MQQHLKKIKKRLYILFWVICTLIVVLLWRLFDLQVVNGDKMRAFIAKSEEITINENVPRGKIYDRNGILIVGNKTHKAITYTRQKLTTTKEILAISENLSKYLKMDTSKLTERDKKDYWIALHPKEARSKMTDEEKEQVAQQLITQAQYDELMRQRVTDKELVDIDLNVLAIYAKMSSGAILSPQFIKNRDVTDEEYALVSENLSTLSGINIGVDWEREYLQGDTLKSLIGTLSINGLPEENLTQYLNKGYTRSDRVGTSYIEQQYEDILKGHKNVVKIKTNKTGGIVDTELIKSGSAGNDIQLSIDINLQRRLEKEVTDYLIGYHNREVGAGRMPTLSQAYAIIQNPNTGELLAVVGKQINFAADNISIQSVSDVSYATVSASYEMGSTVKGATLLTAYQNNLINVGDVKVDEPIWLSNTQVKTSYFNSQGGAVTIDDVTAIQRSSNVYMWKLALDMLGQQYVPGMVLDTTHIENKMNKVRQDFGQVGLGVKTGIDLPIDSEGLKGNILDSPVSFLDEFIGQYDTYTPMQVSQYISTIANGGQRYAPRLGLAVLEPSKITNKMGDVKQKLIDVQLNKINNTVEQLDQVKAGMNLVYTTAAGTGSKYFGDGSYSVAGKTGTAETTYNNQDRGLSGLYAENHAYIGYIPAENPQMSFTVLLVGTPGVNELYLEDGDLARAVVDSYFSQDNDED